MEELEDEVKLMAKNMTKEINEIDTEKVSTTSIKSKVNPEKEMTVNLAMTKNTKRNVLNKA